MHISRQTSLLGHLANRPVLFQPFTSRPEPMNSTGTNRPIPYRCELQAKRRTEKKVVISFGEATFPSERRRCLNNKGLGVLLLVEAESTAVGKSEPQAYRRALFGPKQTVSEGP